MFYQIKKVALLESYNKMILNMQINASTMLLLILRNEFALISTKEK
jgi:hypothetical protein